MDVFTKFKNIAKFIPKKIAAAFGIVAAVAVPAAIWAAAPSFTWQAPAPYVYFNAITDNPNWGDERDFVRISEGSGALTNSISVQNGRTYTITMLVHNDAANNLNLNATGVVGGIFYNTGEANSINVTGVVKADNCGASPSGNVGNLCQFTDAATFTNANNFTLDYVKGSARYQNNAGTFTLPDNVINTGTALGYNQMNGVIPGCWPYRGLLTVKVVARLKEQPRPSYDVEKKVNNVTHNSVRPGDTMTYTIVAKNTGNVELTNVKINDTLPAYYQSASETLPAGATGSIINNPHSVTIPRLAVGATATITISYKVKGQTAFECGKTTNFINAVTSGSDQKNTEDRTDNNQVGTDVTYQCEPKHPSYDLEKTVNKATAKPGETLIYTLTFRNTGDVDLTNVVIKDRLPNGVDWTNVEINVTNGNGITDKDKLFTTGAKIASVRVGGVVTIKITAKVASNAVVAEKCGETSKTLVNRAESSAAEKSGEDNANNNSASTTVTVNKDCPPPKKPCPYNPNLDIDDPNCVPPTKKKCPYNPKLDYDSPDCVPPVIVATGPAETMATIIGTGALTFGAVTYVRSRKDLLGKLLNK